MPAPSATMAANASSARDERDIARRIGEQKRVDEPSREEGNEYVGQGGEQDRAGDGGQHALAAGPMARGVGEHGAHGRARGLLAVRCHVIFGAKRRLRWNADA